MNLIVIAFFAGSSLRGALEDSNNDAEVIVDDEQNNEEQVNDEEDVTDGEVDVVQVGALNVIWNDEFDEEVESTVLKEVFVEDSVIDVKTFLAGTVDGGLYDGYQILNEIIELPGLGTYYQHYYLLTNETREDVIILDRYAFGNNGVRSTSNFTTASKLLGEDRVNDLSLDVAFIDAIIVEFEQTETIKDRVENRYHFMGMGSRINYPYEVSISELRVQSILPNGKSLYQFDEDADGIMDTFLTIREDGYTLFYDLVLPIWDSSESLYASQTPYIRWSEGGAVGEYFKAQPGGCGFRSVVNIVDFADLPPLEQTGTSTLYENGEYLYEIYEPTDYSVERYETAFSSWSRWGQEEEGTLEEFVAIHPFFYFQDELGRWIEFQHADITRGAECGKPVIYLYPEETTDLTVQLEPEGGFTVTEPAYNGGWNVTAYPDGRLYNHGDKQHYPYLFWEGRGGTYAFPETYWVVEREEVQNFLQKQLREFGFNAVEISDFTEFWLPRMQESAYYKIGFHGTEAMNQIAPMTLSEKPDNVLRILMDYQGLDAPVAENPPSYIPAFERDGFTVTEWGGVLK